MVELGRLALYGVLGFSVYGALACAFGALRDRPDWIRSGERAVYEGVEVAWGPEGENGQGINPGAPDRFFENVGNGTFREATEAFGFALEKDLCSYACVFSDVTGDGWPDLLVANDLQPANLFVNDGAGRFEDQAAERGFAFDGEGKPTSAMGLCVADVDADGTFMGLVDGTFLLSFGFVPNSPTPPCMDAADANDDGTVTALSDAVYILGVQFIPGTPAPPLPYPACGPDPTVDSLDCVSHACP